MARPAHHPSEPSRRRFLAAGAIVAAGAAAGCARRADPDALRFWAMSYQGDYAPHLTAPFTAATGIPVDVQSVPWTAAHEKLLTAHAGGVLPDVLMLPNGWIAEFSLIGAIAPVPRPDLVAGLVPGARDSVRIAGRDLAVPWSVAPPVQFYRRDILADAGHAAPSATWDEWRTMAAAVRRRRPDEHVFLMLLNWPGALFTMFHQAGAAMLRDDATRGGFDSAEGREALGYYASLYADGYAPLASSTEVQDPIAAFAQGRFAVWPSGPTTLLDFERRRAELPAERWATARLPGPDGPGPVPAEDACLCVSATSRRQAEAWALVRHLTSADSELRFARMIGTLPARREAWMAPAMSSPTLAPFAAQMATIVPSPQVIEWERIRADVQIVAERVVRGLTTVREGLAEADRRVDRILAKRRALVEAGRLA